MPYVFTVTDMDRPAVRAEMRALMIAAARRRTTLTYSELAAQLTSAPLHPHSFLFTHLLREIGAEEQAAGRGVLPAVVVSKATGMPGGGYFRIGAARLSTPALDPAALEQMWRDDLEALYAYWAEQAG